MEARLRELAELLRRQGFPIGPGEVATALEALLLVGWEDPGRVRATLRCCWLMRGEEAARFDATVDHYFSGLGRFFDAMERSLLQGLLDTGLLAPERLEQVVQSLSPLGRAMLEGDRAALARLFMGAALSLDPELLGGGWNERFVARRLMERLETSRVENELDRAIGDATWSAERLRPALRRIEEAARAYARFEREFREKVTEAPEESRLAPEETLQIEQAARQMAQRLKTRWILKDRARYRGTLNVRRTLRANLSWGGVPLRLAFRSKRRHRPEVVILCDVSESVREVSRMMLAFVDTFRSLFHRTRSFLFVNDLAPEGAALERVPTGGNSNYGRAFGTLLSRELGCLNRRTTLLVIGDGRCNYSDPNLGALKEVKRRIRKLLWITPERESHWAAGDGELPRYAPICDSVVTVKTLTDLARVADQLIPAR